MATLEELETKLKELQKEIILARQETRELAKEKDEQIAKLTQQLEDSNNKLKESLSHVSDLTKAAQTTADRGVNLANTAQATANDGVNRANNAQNTANDGVNRANNAQNTANDGVNKANQAQQTANTAVRGIKFFTIDATINTKRRDNDINITFPEKVDFVALESIINDGNQMWQAIINRINDRTFRVHFKGVHGDGHHWIPSVRFVGIQIQNR